jgi:hypothetical protein
MSTPTGTLSANDLEQYNVSRQKMFRTTIAIAAVFGSIALVFLIIVLTDTNNITGLASDFLPFTITLIGGMLITMLILVAQILTFKPVSTQRGAISNGVCPDYYVLQATPTTDNPDYTGASVSTQAYMQYQCVPDPNTYNLLEQSGATAGTYSAITSASSNSNILGQKIFNYTNPTNYVAGVSISPTAVSTDPISKLYTTIADVYSSSQSQAGATAGSSNLRCDVLYPQYLGMQDAQFSPSNQASNVLRCEYAKQCHIPWTGVCPSYAD